MVKPLKRGILRERIAMHLYDAIRRGELLPGERIVESKLARQLGVAQGSLREALQELEHQGLVTKQENRGTFVAKITTEDVEDIYLVRCHLEPISAGLARERMTSDQVMHLVSLVDQMEAAGSRGDFVELLKADLDFHRFIWQASGSGCILRALNAVCPPLFAGYLIKAASGSTYNQTKDLAEHRSLVSAFMQGSPDEVAKVFRDTLAAFRLQDVENFQAATVSSIHSE